jgi:hypothetical protein
MAVLTAIVLILTLPMSINRYAHSLFIEQTLGYLITISRCYSKFHSTSLYIVLFSYFK